jgi:hypothetical protein
LVITEPSAEVARRIEPHLVCRTGFRMTDFPALSNGRMSLEPKREKKGGHGLLGIFFTETDRAGTLTNRRSRKTRQAIEFGLSLDGRQLGHYPDKPHTNRGNRTIPACADLPTGKPRLSAGSLAHTSTRSTADTPVPAHNRDWKLRSLSTVPIPAN